MGAVEQGVFENSVWRSPFGSEEKTIKCGASVYVLALGVWAGSFDNVETWEQVQLILGRAVRNKTTGFESMPDYDRKNRWPWNSSGGVC